MLYCGMTGLLTRFGIPPRIVGSFPRERRQSMVSFAADKTSSGITREDYLDWQSVPEEMQTFASRVHAVADSFVRWGATIDNTRGWNKIGLFSSHLKKGETTLPQDFNLHSDDLDPYSKLEDDGLVTIRLFCPSSNPADYVDLTGQENMGAILERYRIGDGRAYDRQLLSLAEREGLIIRPKPWDCILSDTITPHDPKGAVEEGPRSLLDAWIEMRLPSDWRARIQSGNAPKL